MRTHNNDPDTCDHEDYNQEYRRSTQSWPHDIS